MRNSTKKKRNFRAKSKKKEKKGKKTRLNLISRKGNMIRLEDKLKMGKTNKTKEFG